MLSVFFIWNDLIFYLIYIFFVSLAYYIVIFNFMVKKYFYLIAVIFKSTGNNGLRYLLSRVSIIKMRAFIRLYFFAAPIYSTHIELPYFSIADELSADIDVVDVVSRTMLLIHFLNVPCRPLECHKCPTIVDPLMK